MKKDLWVWRYALESSGRLNSRADRTVFNGALIREDAGFGCIHPWPELGDPSLEDCLVDLTGERSFPLVRRTAACLKADGLARERGVSLFDDIEVPSSHATLPAMSVDAVEEAAWRGFKIAKVKAGQDVERELACLKNLVRDFPDFRWRVDFNGKGEVGQLQEAFSDWNDEHRARIDFLEDPVPYEGDGWAELGRSTRLTLANDRMVESDRGDSGVLVVKPAVNEMITRGRVVVTSYMDHPVGQAFAAWEAGRAGVDEVCGLQTHGLFKTDEFTEMLGVAGPEFQVPEGTGLGFDDLLEGLSWTKLKA